MKRPQSGAALLTAMIIVIASMCYLAASAIGRGALDTRLSVATRDELGLLVANFNRMAARLARREGRLAADRAALEAELAREGFAVQMLAGGMDAAEAERAGLVSRVVPADKLIEEAVAAATIVAGHSPLAVMMNKEMVEAAYETTLTQGVKLERRLFHSLFAFDDQSEGMAAFVEKRKPDFGRG